MKQGNSKIEQFQNNNREHYREWISISEPNLYKKKGIKCKEMTKGEIERRISELETSHGEIHFHTFSFDSFKEFLKYFTFVFNKDIMLEKIVKNHREIVAILLKSK